MKNNFLFNMTNEKLECPNCKQKLKNPYYYCLLCGWERDGDKKTELLLDLFAKRQEGKKPQDNLDKKTPDTVDTERERFRKQFHKKIEYTNTLNVTDFLKNLDIKTEILKNKEKCNSCFTIIKNKELKICEKCGSELTTSVNDIKELKKYIRDYIIKKENEITRLRAKNYALEKEIKGLRLEKSTPIRNY